MSNIVILSGPGHDSRALYNALKYSFIIDKVIIEKKVSRLKILQRRLKRLGLSIVFGQILFVIFIQPLLELIKRNRILEILAENDLVFNDLPNDIIVHVDSVNGTDTIELLQMINPFVVCVSGTRILSKELLNSVKATFINLHVGITPQYRGVHGAYWALVEDDIENCGVTVHIVDEGIDTGGVLYQSRIKLSPSDNFVTYPYLQLAEGIKLMKQAICDSLSNELKILDFSHRNSKLWYHPTAFNYIYNYYKRKIK